MKDQHELIKIIKLDSFREMRESANEFRNLIHGNISSYNKEGNLVLCNSIHIAVKYKCYNSLFYLIAEGVDINFQETENGNTPLHMALTDDNPDDGIIYLLVEYGADLEIENNEGKRPIGYLSEKQKNMVIRALLANRRLNNFMRNSE